MKTTKWFVLGVCAVALLAVSALPVPASAGSPPPPPGQTLRRVSAQQSVTGVADFDGFDPSDTPTDIFYTQTVKTTAGANVMYITMTGTAGGFCDALLVQCQVDGVNCDPSINSVEADTSTLGGGASIVCSFSVPGWILLGSNDATNDSDWGEQTVAHTWCINIADMKTKKNLHTVTLAGSEACGDGCENTIEQVSVMIDSSKVKDPGLACTGFTLPGD